MGYSVIIEHSCAQDHTGMYIKLTDGSILQIATLEGHTGNVVALAYSALGKWIVTGSEDGTVKVWDTRYVIPIPYYIWYYN